MMVHQGSTRTQKDRRSRLSEYQKQHKDRQSHVSDHHKSPKHNFLRRALTRASIFTWDHSSSNIDDDVDRLTASNTQRNTIVDHSVTGNITMRMADLLLSLFKF